MRGRRILYTEYKFDIQLSAPPGSAVTPVSPTLVKLQTEPDLVDRVYRALQNAIGDGTLAPGARITQEELAARLNVSRQPVLQALRLLKRDGLVQDAPGRGVLVAPLDPQAIVQLYQVRGALDALASHWAATLGAPIDRRLLDRGRKAARGRDVQAMVDADMAFHAAIYAASGNPLIEQSAAVHWVHLRRVMGAVLQAAPSRASVWDEHEQILDAIEAGQAEQAVALTVAHSGQAARSLAQHLGHSLQHPRTGVAP
jgi:DNA-binding GntR family transcriptional regulator